MRVDKFVNMTAREMSNKTGILETTLSKYFNGHRDPSYKSLENIATKLNMSVENVIKGIRLRRNRKKILSKLTRVQNLV